MTTCVDPTCTVPAATGSIHCPIHRLQQRHRDLAEDIDPRYFPHEHGAHMAVIELCDVVAELHKKVRELDERTIHL
jgi:hypothetical protein